MDNLRQRVETELRSNILPFWLKYMIDTDFGGFRGQISNDLTINPKAPKGLILNARILWTFSRAFSVYRDEVYLQTARRAYDYLSKHFWDEEFGGVFWMLDYLGRPVDTKKRIYGQAFTVYSLAEFYRATKDKGALEKAIRMYRAIEKASHDEKYGGYFETYDRNWTLAQDQRLSAVDMDEKKSMNTHLHLMEAYATLLSQWNDAGLRARLEEIIQLFLQHIIDPQSHHFIMFFDEQWHPRSNKMSFGHDIEGSWLLHEATEILGDESLRQQVRQAGLRMARAVYDKAVDRDGGLQYEGDPSGIIDSDKHWWPQAEAVVGFLNAYQLTGEKHFWTATQRSWDFIDKYIIDHQHGEWFWKVSREGIPSQEKFKVDPWKCPYHNSRTCFEVMARTDAQGQAVMHTHTAQLDEWRTAMNQALFQKKVKALLSRHEKLIRRKNVKLASNGVFERWANPVVTAEHTPIFWRYDLDHKSNPHLMERMSINATFNAGAMEFDGKYLVFVRVEGVDRKSFLAVAESPNGVDNFRFWDYPILMPETGDPDVNVYDVRVVRHEDGWIYGLFCTERKDPNASTWDTSSATAQCGIARTKDLKSWTRLADLKTKSPQQRNVVLHPEFINGKYAFYTRPQDEFIQAGKGGGIGWGLSSSIENAVIENEVIMDNREYHTIKEVKNGLGPAPIKTKDGWLHLAHGVRNTAAGLRYVLYMFLCRLDKPEVITHRPTGYFIGPQGDERVGDVSNVVFSNGWIERKNGDVFIYYGASDTRLNVATTTVERLLDYVKNTPEDPLRSYACVEQRYALIKKNLAILHPAGKGRKRASARK